MAAILDRVTARNLIALKIEDPQQTKFTAAQYNTAIELGQEQFCLDTKSVVKQTTLTEVTGVTNVALPTDFIDVVLVRHIGIKLAPTTRYDLSFQSGQDWTTLPNGVPTMYYIDQQADAIGLVPAPDSGNAGANLTLTYIAIPPVLTADTGTGGWLLNNDFILQYYSPAIVNWAASEMITYAPITAELAQKREIFLKDYERYMNQAISIYNNMADQPIQMRGGKMWQDQTLFGVPNAFTDW